MAFEHDRWAGFEVVIDSEPEPADIADTDFENGPLKRRSLGDLIERYKGAPIDGTRKLTWC